MNTVEKTQFHQATNSFGASIWRAYWLGLTLEYHPESRLLIAINSQARSELLRLGHDGELVSEGGEYLTHYVTKAQWKELRRELMRIQSPATEALLASLTAAIRAAMDNYREHGWLSVTRPAIVRCGAGFAYQSALHPHDGAVWDLQEGLGAFEPDEDDDLDMLALNAAAVVASENSLA